MSWIKRNLYFLIGSVVALALMGMAGWYLYSEWQLDNAAKDDLNPPPGTLPAKGYAELERLYNLKPHPGDEKVDNIKEAQKQQDQLRELLGQARKHFERIPAIPVTTKINSQRFSAALRDTIAQLQREAVQASVSLPPKYDFTFQAVKPRVTHAPESLPLLAAQLGEVKAICGILFHAKIHSLENLRRERVSSDDDPQAAAADYLEQKSVTNDLARLAPYEISFRCFSADLAAVLDGFKRSPHCFIVRSIRVEPAAALASPEAAAAGGAAASSAPESVARRYGLEGAPAPAQPGTLPSAAASGARAGPARGGVPIVVNEKLLKVSLLLEVVKLIPPPTGPS